MRCTRHWWWAMPILIAVAVLTCAGWLFIPPAAWAGTPGAPCHIDWIALGSPVPLTGGGPTVTCLVAVIMANPSTAGTVGPVEAHMDASLYGFFLDRPETAARLASALELSPHQVTKVEADTYLFDDGAGARGTFRLLFQEGFRRLYVLQGIYQGALWPQIRGEAILYLTATPTGAQPLVRQMNTTIQVYSRLEPSLVATLIRLINPLVEGMISRRVARGVLVLSQLGEALATDPARVAQAVAILSGLNTADRADLLRLLSSNSIAAHPTVIPKTP